jgi:hypothetical protein
MRHVLPNSKVEYMGGDVVLPLIEELNRKYKSDSVSFVHLDMISDTLPRVDLVICRDCLFHFSYSDTKLFLENFVRSNSSYLLSTTHINQQDEFTNKDIATGDFRRIDLYTSPYNFPPRPLYVIDDWIDPFPKRQMCLWDRNQISTALENSQKRNLGAADGHNDKRN